MPTPVLTSTRTLDTIMATTVDILRRQLTDNMTHNVRCFKELNQADSVESRAGGDRIVEPLATDLNSNVTFLSGGSSTFDVAHQQPGTRAEFQWKEVVAPVTLWLRELLANQSPAGVTSIMSVQIRAAELTLHERLANRTVGVFSNNGDNPEGLSGLQSLVAAAPTANTVGNIAGSSLNTENETYWANIVGTAIDDWSNNGETRIRDAAFQCVRGNDMVNLHVTTRTGAQRWIELLTSTKQMNLPVAVPMTTKSAIDARAPVALFDGAPVIFDFYAPADQWRGLNLNYLKLVFQEGAEFTALPFTRPPNATYVVGGLVCRLELITNARNRHFYIAGADSGA